MNTKTIIAAALGLIGLAGAAHAEGTPFLNGNYSANVLNSYNSGVRTATQLPGAQSSRFGYSGEFFMASKRLAAPAGMSHQDDLIGNYAPNVRIEDVRGH